MICASCGQKTASDPCAVCEEQATLGGKYRLLECLGRGGFGTTYLAEGPDGARVAVKELPYHLAASPKARELLFREIRILRELNHPAIPMYLADFSTGKGRHRVHCLVQEYVEGHTLAEEMENHRYSPEEVLDVLKKLLPILTYLHSLSPPVIHRDIKPANIIRRTDGSLALVDFGSVRDVLATTLGGSTVIGTFGYMAPEQFRGEATPQTDLHALGAVAVALLTRQEPGAVLDDHNRIAWRRFTHVHPALGALVDDLLAHEVEHRPATAAEGARRVAEVAALISSPTHAEAIPIVEPELFDEPLVTVRPMGGRSRLHSLSHTLMATGTVLMTIGFAIIGAISATAFVFRNIAVDVDHPIPVAPLPEVAEPEVVPSVGPPAASSIDESVPLLERYRTGDLVLRIQGDPSVQSCFGAGGPTTVRGSLLLKANGTVEFGADAYSVNEATACVAEAISQIPPFPFRTTMPIARQVAIRSHGQPGMGIQMLYQSESDKRAGTVLLQAPTNLDSPIVIESARRLIRWDGGGEVFISLPDGTYSTLPASPGIKLPDFKVEAGQACLYALDELTHEWVGSCEADEPSL